MNSTVGLNNALVSNEKYQTQPHATSLPLHRPQGQVFSQLLKITSLYFNIACKYRLCCICSTPPGFFLLLLILFRMIDENRPVRMSGGGELKRLDG